MDAALLRITKVTTGEKLLEYDASSFSKDVAEGKVAPPSALEFKEKVSAGPTTEQYDRVLQFISATQEVSYRFFGKQMAAQGGATRSGGASVRSGSPTIAGSGGGGGAPADAESSVRLNSSEWSQSDHPALDEKDDLGMGDEGLGDANVLDDDDYDDAYDPLVSALRGDEEPTRKKARN